MLRFEHLSDKLFNFPFKRDVSENFDNSDSDGFLLVVHEIQESQVNFLLCDESPAVIDWTDIDEDVSDDPSSVFLDLHKPIQDLQHESSFLSFVDDFFNDWIKFGDVEKDQKRQFFS